ncbi:MAG: hypothetical protein ACX939_01045 [Hyphococcus sp.]
MRSNEFTGATLGEALRKATAAYHRTSICELKNHRRCNDLILMISSLQNDLSRIADDIARLEGDADRLRDSVKVEVALAMIAAVSSLSGAFRAARIIIRRIKNKDPAKLTEREILDLLALFGPIGSAAAALHAASQLREAKRLARRAEEIERSGERLGDELIAAIREYDRIGCRDGGRFTS